MGRSLLCIICLACIMLSGCVNTMGQFPVNRASGSIDKSDGLTNDDIINGLKEALIVGATNSSAIASKTDGFNLNQMIRIPFPPEAQKMKAAVEKIGYGSLVKDFELSLNRSAEEASKKAFPIFKDAIMGMSITDGINILRGPKNAATEYLKSKTQSLLFAEFTPVVKKSIQTVNVTKYWEPLASAYNTTTMFTGQAQVTPNLEQYITQRALDGLFFLISQEEMKIRENPAARVSDILKKVFSSM